MNRNSFFLRLFVGNLLIVVVVVVVAAVLSYRAVNAQYLQASNAYQDNLTLVAAQYLADVWPLPDAEVDRFCKGFPGSVRHEPAGEGVGPAWTGPVRITVIARDGRVLGDSESDPAKMENHRTESRREVMAALGGRPGVHVHRSETLAVDFRYVARPITHEGEVVGVVRIATSVLAILQNQAFLRGAIGWGSVTAVAGFALLGLLINWIWYVPLRRITAAARQIAAGDLETRARVTGPAELVDLGSALNAMRDGLATQIKTISAQRENLERIVSSLREGVVALDAQGRIALMNRAAASLLAADEDKVVGRHFQEVVRVSAIVEVCNEAERSTAPVGRQAETEIGGRHCHLDIHAVRLAPALGNRLSMLVMVRDVTELVSAAAMKTEFVANASHELRTPLATLRAAVESLDATGFADQESLAKTVAILHRQLNRLEGLTLDLLDLHAAETAPRNGAKDRIPLESLEEWARQQFTASASEKGVALECTVGDPEDAFTSDRKLLELILQNLVENAIKFTPAGGRVSCRMERQDGHMQFRVTDTGVGIRREDQIRVFERFFQVEVSRSGDTKARGTGLGLAIVKHAAERLGAAVDLQSELGRGTTVTVLVPDRAVGD